MQMALKSIYTQNKMSIWQCPFFPSVSQRLKNGCLKFFLRLNTDKIEVMLINSPHQLHKAELCTTLSMDGSALQFQTKLKNLGVVFDAN